MYLRQEEKEKANHVAVVVQWKCSETRVYYIYILVPRSRVYNRGPDHLSVHELFLWSIL